jgi:hypothetical protein
MAVAPRAMQADLLDQRVGLVVGSGRDLRSSELSRIRTGSQTRLIIRRMACNLQAHRLDMLDPFLVGSSDWNRARTSASSVARSSPATASRVAMAIVRPPPITVSTPPRRAQNRSTPALFQLTMEIASAVRNGAWPGRIPKLPLASSARRLSILVHHDGQGGDDPQPHAAASASVASAVSVAFAAASFLRASSSVPTM